MSSIAQNPTALVTGASRGIGAATALALAKAGYDVAVAARTVQEGDGEILLSDNTKISIPGSLEHIASGIEKCGRTALMLPMDLLDPDSVIAAADVVISEWGRVDVLVNNAIYKGAGMMDRLLDVTPEELKRVVDGTFTSSFLLTQKIVKQMRNQIPINSVRGTVINTTSDVVLNFDSPALPHDGGWGVAYAAAKQAFHKITGAVHLEFYDEGIRAYNLFPGWVITEALKASGTMEGFETQYKPTPPEAFAHAAAWLARGGAQAEELSGKAVNAPKLCKSKKLFSW